MKKLKQIWYILFRDAYSKLQLERDSMQQEIILLKGILNVSLEEKMKADRIIDSGDYFYPVDLMDGGRVYVQQTEVLNEVIKKLTKTHESQNILDEDINNHYRIYIKKRVPDYAKF